MKPLSLLFKRVDRFLDLMEEFKNIADIAAGSYVKQIEMQVNNKDAKESDSGRYKESPQQAYGLIQKGS